MNWRLASWDRCCVRSSDRWQSKIFPRRERATWIVFSKAIWASGCSTVCSIRRADDKTHIIVTTDALLAHWLREHKDWWGPKVANVPQQVNAALTSEAFYTQALQTDAAISKYVELPVAKPAQAKFAFAMLSARSQDIGPRTADELIVAVVQGTRVFVVSAPANAKIEPMPACQQIWQEAEQKAAAAQDAYIASQLKDEKLSEQSNRLQEEGDAAFHRCFAQRAKSEKFFAESDPAGARPHRSSTVEMTPVRTPHGGGTVSSFGVGPPRRS